MPYIIREDGERFIIPSYRDTISAKKTSTLKKELRLLSTSYGEYIALQKKAASQYEVAFSPDTGYLLGECIWDHFKRPFDMIYCEAIPNTTEAILVIVKAGTVYLDGSFQIDSIPEELLVFKSQSNNFSIFIHGNVPISQTPEEGKVSFDEETVKSFDVLAEPAFPKLPTVKAFQLQLLDIVLKEYGIGVLPIKQMAIAVGSIVLVYFIYGYISTHKKIIEIPTTFIVASNPYQGYLDQLASPDPAKVLHSLVPAFTSLYAIQGWTPSKITFTPGSPSKLRVGLTQSGGSVASVFDWGHLHDATVELLVDGMYLNMVIPIAKREPPTTIASMQNILTTMMDRILFVMPSTPITLVSISNKKAFNEAEIEMTIPQGTPFILDVISMYIAGLPLVLTNADFQIQDGYLSGTLTFKALGN